MNSAQFLYRIAEAGDAAAMVEVHYAAVQAIGTTHYSEEILSAWSPLPDEHRRKWLADLIAGESTLCTVALTDRNRIIGFGFAHREQSKLRALYVHPEFAGRGVGQALLRNIEARCRTSGLERLELNASFNAEDFYRHCGYARLGPVTQSLNDNLAMNAIHMVKHFSMNA